MQQAAVSQRSRSAANGRSDQDERQLKVCRHIARNPVSSSAAAVFRSPCGVISSAAAQLPVILREHKHHSKVVTDADTAQLLRHYPMAAAPVVRPGNSGAQAASARYFPHFTRRQQASTPDGWRARRSPCFVPSPSSGAEARLQRIRQHHIRRLPWQRPALTSPGIRAAI